MVKTLRVSLNFYVFSKKTSVQDFCNNSAFLILNSALKKEPALGGFCFTTINFVGAVSPRPPEKMLKINGRAQRPSPTIFLSPLYLHKKRNPIFRVSINLYFVIYIYFLCFCLYLFYPLLYIFKFI